LLKNGQIKLIEKTNDQTDTLFASDKNGNVDKSKSVTVEKGIVGQLQYLRDGNFPGSKNLHDITPKGIKLLRQAKTGKDFR